MIVLNDDELMRYSRQILLESWDLDAQLALKNSRVLIVGCGGLGCPVAQTLVRAGVGHLLLIDFDVVEISNLQRQVLFDDSHLGIPKAQAAKQVLMQQNPCVNIDAQTRKLDENNISHILQQQAFDLVIDCTDNFSVRDLLNQFCRRYQLALLSLSAIAQVGQVALYTKESGCYRCVFGDEAGDETTCSTSGVLASTVLVVGALGGQLALTWLGCGINPLHNRLLLWQGQNLQIKQLPFLPDVHCAVCANPTSSKAK